MQLPHDSGTARKKRADSAGRAEFDYRIYGFILVGALLLIWEVSARFNWVQSTFWPPVSEVFVTAVTELVGGEILTMLSGTLWRTFAGFAIGSAIGVVLGVLLAKNKWFRYAILPLIEVIRPIPTPAIIPPLILFLGVNDALKIFTISLAVFFPVFTNAFSGVYAIDDTLLQTARTFRTNWRRTMTRVVFPATLPSISAGLRTSLAIALIVAVVSEMISGSSGIGYFIVQMQYALRPAHMYAAIIYLALIGYLLNRGFLALETRLIPWLGKA